MGLYFPSVRLSSELSVICANVDITSVRLPLGPIMIQTTSMMYSLQTLAARTIAP